jgi:hypothetical protein
MYELEIHDATLKAVEELKMSSIKDIEKASAFTWLGRALASYAHYEETGRLECLIDAENYAGEAVEHGALAHPSVYQAVLCHLEVAKRNYQF